MNNCLNCGSSDVRDLGPIENGSDVHQYQCQECDYTDYILDMEGDLSAPVHGRSRWAGDDDIVFVDLNLEDVWHHLLGLG